MRSIDCRVEKVLIVANRWGERLDASVEEALRSIRENPPAWIGEVEIYETPGNLGAAGSYNYLLRELGPCIIAANDARFLPGVLAQCLDFIRENGDAVLHYLFAMCVFHVPQRFLDEVGYFDENFWPWGWDDIDVGYRIKKRGLKTANFPGRERGIIHDHPTQSIFASATPLRNWMVQMSNRNSDYGMRKWGIRKEQLSLLDKGNPWSIDLATIGDAGNDWVLNLGTRSERIKSLMSDVGIATEPAFCFAEREHVRRDTVCLATIWPVDPTERAEDFILRELLAEYAEAARVWSLRVVVASAHRGALDVARAVCAEFPCVAAEFWYLETEYAGTRGEEISFCKEQLPLRLAAAQGWDWLLYYDADVWTRIAQVDAWMAIIGAERERCFVKIKYALRDLLESPAVTLGAYFHHRSLLERMEYWKVIFPRDASGHRLGAPDCLLHNFLEGNGCRKVVPKGMRTLHFRNKRDAQGFDDGRCFVADGAREGDGLRLREAEIFQSQKETEPTRMKFAHVVPYSQEGNLADAYNEAIEAVDSAVEWILITDADVMFLTPRYGHLIATVIAEHPEAGLITCVTNRIGAPCQLAPEVPKETADLLALRSAALARVAQYGTAVTQVAPPCSGFFMLFRRAVWKQVGRFKGRGIFDVDWRFSKEVARAGLPILRMDGLLAVHYYRLDGSNATVVR